MTRQGSLRLAGMVLHVPESTVATRDGLDGYNLRARWHPLPDAPQAWLSGEAAWERKDNVAAVGWYAALNYSAKDAPWKPLASLRYASFSGDKAGTAKWEGFDPLFFGGSDPDWYQGKLASTLFNNTNLDSVAVTLTLTPDDRNILQVVYVNFRAAETGSPLSIPAAGQPLPTGGVPAKPLANELDATWTYTFSKQVNVNVFVAYAVPGAGYRQLYASQGGAAHNWSGFGTQLNISY